MDLRVIYCDDVYDLDTEPNSIIIASVAGKFLSADVVDDEKKLIIRFSYEVKSGKKTNVNEYPKFLWVDRHGIINDNNAEFYKSFVYKGDSFYLYILKGKLTFL